MCYMLLCCSTVLCCCVVLCRSSAAEALLEGGAHVDTPDRAGRTALSYAAMYGSTDCIYLLAGRGADVGHVDADGNTPLELAEGSGRQSAVDALKKLQLRVKMQEKRKVGPVAQAGTDMQLVCQCDFVSATHM